MPQYDPYAISKASILAIRKVIKEVNSKVEKLPAIFLDKQYNHRRKKLALTVDILAEATFRDELEKHLGGEPFEVEVFGEETIDEATSFTGKRGVFALADMIDGTDLLERGLSNWCSAVVFFSPQYEPGHRIIAATVGLSSGDIYYSHQEKDHVGVYINPEAHPELKLEDKHRAVAKAHPVREMDEASICFYGQKAKNMHEVFQTNLISHLTQLDSAKKTADDKAKVSRLYNLGGIPMMVKLIDPRAKAIANNIDAVFDVHGQHPHDVVAGAYLALKAKAVMKDLDGGEITDIQLEDALLEPSSSSFKYVLSSTEELCDSILAQVTSSKT
jgi:fructose-1,6-bisphosphatase/inositol monophosphatase family enzyme